LATVETVDMNYASYLASPAEKQSSVADGIWSN
jgi:hypothetical protein